MNLLITAGNTQTPIDRVRCITNIFTGRTGAQVALEAHRRGHGTSSPRTRKSSATWTRPSNRMLAGRSARTGRSTTCMTRWPN